MNSLLRYGRGILAGCLVSLLCLLVGCNGCQQQADEKLTKEELEKKRQAERTALVVRDMRSLPLDAQMSVMSAKPGHWYEAIQQFKSNREDMQVMLASSVYYGNDRANLPSTNFTNEYSRKNLFLPKGQEKTVSLQIYVPPTTKSRQKMLEFDPANALNTNSTALRIQSELRVQPLMNSIPNSEKLHGARELQPITTHLVVLTPQPLIYQYLENLDAVRWLKTEFEMENERIVSFEVKLVGSKDFLSQASQSTATTNTEDQKLIAGQISDQYAMPHSFLTMTSIGAILWDDIGADELSADQQKAILDWLHWGGQLIISGPTSWTRLQGSFLSPYLPANVGETAQLTATDFAQLSQTFEVLDVSRGSTLHGIEVLDQPLSGLRFQLNERGEWLPGSGELVAESRVGRGRIVMTGFSLRETAIRNWPYASSFFSTGLLRRPARQIQTVSGEIVGQKQFWAAPFRSRESDPLLHSNIRLVSRDVASSRIVSGKYAAAPSSDGDDASVTQNTGPAEKYDLFNPPAYEPIAWGGTGAWSDFSGVAQEAIMSLRAAAGIELPSRETILKLLGGYLICLVPLNWLVFKLIRRLEYAWIAAPIMSLIGVIVVGKVARLDIGFARRTTEISVLEMHGNYPRAHLTQYVALYTSLSTNYAIEFPESDSVALPMGDVQRVMRRTQNTTRELQTKYGEADGVVLEPLTVYSNSTEMLHSEQILEFNDSLALRVNDLGAQTLFNGTNFAIQGSLLLRRTANQLEAAWLGRLEPGQATEVQWSAARQDQLFEPWSKDIKTQKEQPAEEELSTIDGIWVGGLLHHIANTTPLVDGQIRLVGFTDQPLGGLKISPSQDQYDRICAVVAHLTPAKLGSITPDRNIASRGSQVDPVDVTPSDPATPQPPPEP
jgi:hypothetical protein